MLKFHLVFNTIAHISKYFFSVYQDEKLHEQSQNLIDKMLRTSVCLGLTESKLSYLVQCNWIKYSNDAVVAHKLEDYWWIDCWVFEVKRRFEESRVLIEVWAKKRVVVEKFLTFLRLYGLSMTNILSVETTRNLLAQPKH